MGEAHTRFEELAVGHVLGGLSPGQAAEFRRHLQTCEGCRSRVAELHGIADELAAAEREERERVAARPTEPPDAGPVPSGRLGVRQVTAAVLVVLALSVGLAFWNLHLRTTATTLRGVAEAQGDALERLASGAALQPVLAPGVSGQVVTDGSTVTLTLAGLAPLAADERLVAWFGGGADPDRTPPRVLAGPGELPDGSVAVSLEVGDATELRVTREVGTSQRAPEGTAVLDVILVADRAG
ncbi:MAG: zf-HC2 domain-containing protein [Nitriliruptoraceae bacterium]